MSYIKSQLADVERGCGHSFYFGTDKTTFYICGRFYGHLNRTILCDACQAKHQTLLMCQAEREKELKEILSKDIQLFEDARDILLDLKRQGVGTGDCEKIFDDRIKEITALLEGDGQNG